MVEERKDQVENGNSFENREVAIEWKHGKLVQNL